METEEINKIIEKYTLSEEEQKMNALNIFIKTINAYGAKTSKNPFAIIVIGQPGAGKTNLMRLSESEFEENSAISFDIDNIRSYYPKLEEVKNNYLELYEKITGKFASQMIHYLTEMLIHPEIVSDDYKGQHFNMLLHKTRGDDAVVKDTIIPLKENGYDIVMRVLAVDELESRYSLLSRPLHQKKELGYCRWVEKDYHNKNYNAIVDLAEDIEKTKKVDCMQVYTRGDGKDSDPNLYYTKVLNPAINENPTMRDAYGFPKLYNFKTKNEKNVREAIIEARKLSLSKVQDIIPRKISQLEKDFYIDDTVAIKIQELKDLYNEKFSDGQPSKI